MINDILKKNIKTLREQKGYKLEYLAYVLNKDYNLPCDKSAISKWANGISKPDVYQLDALAKIFNVSMEDLLHVDFSANEVSDLMKSMFATETTNDDADSIVYPILCDDSEFVFDRNVSFDKDIMQAFHAIRYMEKNEVLPEEEIFIHKLNAFVECNLLKGMCSEMLAYKLKQPPKTLEDHQIVNYLLNSLSVSEDEKCSYDVRPDDIVYSYTIDPKEIEFPSQDLDLEGYSYYYEDGVYSRADELKHYYECLSRIRGYFDVGESNPLETQDNDFKIKALEDMVDLAKNNNLFATEYLNFWLNLKNKSVVEAEKMLEDAKKWERDYLTCLLDKRKKLFSGYDNDLAIDKEKAKDLVTKGPLLFDPGIIAKPYVEDPNHPWFGEDSDIYAPMNFTYLQIKYPAHFSVDEFLSKFDIKQYGDNIIQEFKEKFADQQFSYIEAIKQLNRSYLRLKAKK